MVDGLLFVKLYTDKAVFYSLLLTDSLMMINVVVWVSTYTTGTRSDGFAWSFILLM